MFFGLKYLVPVGKAVTLTGHIKQLAVVDGNAIQNVYQKGNQ